MTRRGRYRRASAQPTELDMTTFLNLMVVLVPFLLISAVFSRITIVELDMPSSQGGPETDQPNLRLEVIVRDAGFEITNGKVTIASIPKLDDVYDLQMLNEMAISLKLDNPDATQASVLLEPQIEYDHLIQVMDAVRSASLNSYGEVVHDEDEAQAETEDMPTRVALFTNISIGDAP